MRERGEGGRLRIRSLIVFFPFCAAWELTKNNKKKTEEKRETQQLRVSSLVHLACRFDIPFSYLHFFALLVLYSFRFAFISGSAALHAPPVTCNSLSLRFQFELHMCSRLTHFSHAIPPSRFICCFFFFSLFPFRVPLCFVLSRCYPSHVPIAVRCWRRLGEREGGGGRSGDGRTRPHSIEPHFLSSCFSLYLPVLLLFPFVLGKRVCGRACLRSFFCLRGCCELDPLWTHCLALLLCSHLHQRALSRYRSPPSTPPSRTTHVCVFASLLECLGQKVVAKGSDGEAGRRCCAPSEKARECMLQVGAQTRRGHAEDSRSEPKTPVFPMPFRRHAPSLVSLPAFPLWVGEDGGS